MSFYARYGLSPIEMMTGKNLSTAVATKRTLPSAPLPAQQSIDLLPFYLQPAPVGTQTSSAVPGPSPDDTSSTDQGAATADAGLPKWALPAAAAAAVAVIGLVVLKLRKKPAPAKVAGYRRRSRR